MKQINQNSKAAFTVKLYSKIYDAYGLHITL